MKVYEFTKEPIAEVKCCAECPHFYVEHVPHRRIPKCKLMGKNVDLGFYNKIEEILEISYKCPFND